MIAHCNSLCCRTAFALLTASALVAGCGYSLETGPEPNMTAALKIRETFGAASGKATKASSGSASGETEMKRLDGWATLTGRFVLEGNAPSPSRLNVDKDQAVCGAHQLFDESIVIGKDRGIANVVIYVTTRKIPINKSFDKSATDSIVLDNKGCRFEPHVQKVRVGQTLVVKNSDPVAHNTNIAGRNIQANPLIASGATAEFPIAGAEPDPAKVSCNIHPWMKARVVVTSHPYCAVSKDDGSFELADLPAGDLEFQIWQENAGSLDVKNADLQPGSGPGRFKISLKPGDKKDLKDIVVTTAALKSS
jgi:plastocyanin